MSDLTSRIQNLEAAEAVSLLSTIARQRVRSHAASEVTPDATLVAELAAAVGTGPAATADEGELAKVCLQLVADDPAMRPVLEQMIENPPAESFSVDPLTLTLGVGALVILQSYIEIERDKNGKWTFKFKKQPMTDTLLGQVISKLGGWLKGA
ncbi:hypothetical protein [Frigoriglobus tundricola]|uniref:Uncharacterized protein n=1 Tax=Frigoriglobus tundricola TaxID=2774151 RepID=A0A6M5Z3D7_9BACT|nr:hypothetical protein [Frigoriglobus tundricola]QJX00928.1 hypothetical protein FTUN_8566 [Frigoriglobus tundricola]